MPTSFDLPQCPNFQRGTCPRSQVIILKEGTNEGERFFSFGCETCLVTFVQTAPSSQARARYQNRLAQHAQREREMARWNSRTRFFTPGPAPSSAPRKVF